MSDDDNVIDMLKAVSSARSAAHVGHASTRQLSENYDEKGLAGEVAFARAFRLPLDLEKWGRRQGGDGGIDFYLPWMFTIDVKTSQQKYSTVYLLVEVGKVRADIYVLAGFNSNLLDARLLGWTWGGVVEKAPTREFTPGLVSHYIAADKLKPMWELRERIAIIGYGFDRGGKP